MAKAITQIAKTIPTIEQQTERAKQEILEAAAKNKESVLQLFELLNDLKQTGLLEMAHSFIANRHRIGLVAMNQLNKSGAQHMIKNGMEAVQFLAALEPDKLNSLLGALASGAAKAAEKQAVSKRIGVLGMLKALKEKEIQISLGMLFNFLRGMGGYLQRKHR